MSYVIGIDLGTQSMKGLLVDPAGRVVTEAAHPHEPSYPKPGWAQQHVPDWIASLKNVVAALLGRSGVNPDSIGTIGFDSQVDGAVAVDADGNVLSEAIIWCDRRAEQQCADIGSRIDEDRIFQLTGLNLDPSHVAPKLLWIRDEQPEVFAKAKNIYLPGSYMVYWLTGQSAVDYSNASSSMLYNVRSKAWDDELAGAVGIDPMLMGRIGPAEEVAGTLTVDAARELGLSTATKVIIGCGDEHAACLGSGLVKPGLVCDIVGTAEPVAAVADRPVFDDIDRLVETHAHADSRYWLIENPGFVSGGTIQWYARQVAQCSYKELDAAAATAPPGCDGLAFLPCMSGAMTPRWNARARGVFTGMSMSHSLAHMNRAVLEGCAYGLRDNIDRFEEIGIPVREIRAVGGGTKSDIWCQIKADCTGKLIRRNANPEGAAVGAAMLAAVAEGTFGSLDEAAHCMVALDRVYEPDPRLKPVYDEAYALYRAAYNACEPMFDSCYTQQA